MSNNSANLIVENDGTGSQPIPYSGRAQHVWKVWNYVVVKKKNLRTVLDVVRFDDDSQKSGDNTKKDLFLRFKDSSGNVVNEVEIGSNGDSLIYTVDLGIFLKKHDIISSENRKSDTLDTAFYGTVEVHMPVRNAHKIRLVTLGKGDNADEVVANSPVRGSFQIFRTSPFHFFMPRTQGSSTTFVLMNHEENPVEVQFRLYFDHFYREVVRKIPSKGVKLLKIENEFYEVLKSERESIPRFIRISQRSDKDKISVQLIEQVVNEVGVETYRSVS